jgi:hypothetical protein
MTARNSSTQRIITGTVFGMLTVIFSSLTPAADNPGKVSMCAAAERVLFSCTLASGAKQVSVCATGNARAGAPSFYYAYGKQGKPAELRYPASDASAANFTRTSLGFAGNTGGFAYGFNNGGFKYLLYSISGSYGLEDQGLIVQKDGQEKPVKQSKCVAGTVFESEDDELFRITRQWPADQGIAQHGLPGH